MSESCNRLHVMAFGLAMGLLWGIGVLITGLVAVATGDYGMKFIEVIGSVYPGYTATVMGSLIGAGIGFLDGLIGGVIFAWLYNCISGCCQKCCSKSD